MVKNFNIKTGCLNVCGLRRRLSYPEFSDKLKRYEIVGVLETELDTYDVIDVEGYSFIQQPRKQNYLRKSGGIGVFIKDCLASYVNVINSASDYVMWLKLDRKAVGSNNDIVFVFIYQPPDNSSIFLIQMRLRLRPRPCVFSMM